MVRACRYIALLHNNFSINDSTTGFGFGCYFSNMFMTEGPLAMCFDDKEPFLVLPSGI